MSFSLEKKENSMALVTIEVSEQSLEKAMQNAYTASKKQFSIPGFRKGKVPRQVLERMYGKDIFCQDAANALVYEEYSKFLEECDESIVSDPTFDIVKLTAGEPFIFTAEVALKPPFSLGKYKGVQVDKADISVTEEEITKAVDEEREKNSRTVTIEDRPVKDGDIATIDFLGEIDGVAFEGGAGEDYPLTIGSGSFIPGFEEQLIGVSTGDKKDVVVTFPEDYHAEDLKGKEAVFHCTVKLIKEKQLPDADDDFASEVSEYETMDEYRNYLKGKLEEKKSGEARKQKEDAVLDKVIEDSHVEIPEPMLKTQQHRMVEEFGQMLRMQGMTLENYYRYTGSTEEAMLDSVKEQAEKRIKIRLALEAVAEAEGIKPTDEDLDKEAEKMAQNYGMTKERFLEMTEKEEKAKKQILDDIACNKAIDFLVENSVEG